MKKSTQSSQGQMNSQRLEKRTTFLYPQDQQAWKRGGRSGTLLAQRTQRYFPRRIDQSTT